MFDYMDKAFISLVIRSLFIQAVAWRQPDNKPMPQPWKGLSLRDYCQFTGGLFLDSCQDGKMASTNQPLLDYISLAVYVNCWRRINYCHSWCQGISTHQIDGTVQYLI